MEAFFLYAVLYILLLSARYWELVEKHKINHFYTTPHVIQKLKSLDKDNATSYDMTSLRIIGSGMSIVYMQIKHKRACMYVTVFYIVGDSLHSESWEWLYRQFGQSKCPLIDTWWQTGNSFSLNMHCLCIVP